MNYGKLTAGTTKTAIDTAKPSEKGEIITYLSRMGDVLHNVTDCGESIAVSTLTVHAVVDGNEPHIVAGEDDVGVLAYSQVITTKAG